MTTTLSQRVEQLLELAEGFAAEDLSETAIELLALVLRLDPTNGEARDRLGELRRSQRKAGQRATGTLTDALREEIRRSAIDGAHFVGLASLYAARGELSRAADCLEIAKNKAPSHPGHHKLHGQVLLRGRDFAGSVAELGKALSLDPFDRNIAEMLSRAAYEARDFEASISAAVHAFLLLDDVQAPEAEKLRTRILTLKRLLTWDKSRLRELFNEQRQQLDVAFDRLQWHRERLRDDDGTGLGGALFGSPPRPQRGGVIVLAARLRTLGVWSNLKDEQVFRLTSAVQEEFHDVGSLVMAHGDPGRDLFVLEQGEITVRRPTPYGVFRLGVLPPGEILGEVSFLVGGQRSGDALATKPCQVLRFEAETLERILAEDSALAVQVYWSLWHSLARKLRRTTDQLRNIFADDSIPENFLRLRRSAPGTAEQVEVDSDAKIEILQEQGLSHHDIVTLATFSREKRFPEGSFVFREGDTGDDMYVVLEGRAIISTYIPGGGDEALAILSRGEFFGEMALIDGQPRSADARAHEGPLTVLALSQQTVREVLALDPDAALEFLQLLCRLLTDRLREIDEKVIGWRILAGGHPSSAQATG